MDHENLKSLGLEKSCLGHTSLVAWDSR